MILSRVVNSFINNHFLVGWLGGGGRLTGEPEYAMRLNDFLNYVKYRHTTLYNNNS
jgi:hypothetical protein